MLDQSYRKVTSLTSKYEELNKAYSYKYEILTLEKENLMDGLELKIQ